MLSIVTAFLKAFKRYYIVLHFTDKNKRIQINHIILFFRLFLFFRRSCCDIVLPESLRFIVENFQNITTLGEYGYLALPVSFNECLSFSTSSSRKLYLPTWSFDNFERTSARTIRNLLLYNVLFRIIQNRCFMN